MKITKVYELAGMAAGKLQTKFCDCEIELNFRNGMGASGTEKAVLITSEPFIQDAIEADSRFGSLIRLSKTYENSTDASNEYQQNGSPTMGETYAVKQAEAIKAVEEERAKNEKAKKEEMRKKRQQAAEAKKVAEKQIEAKGSTETTPDGGIVFDNVNEAMAFLIEKGETVTEETFKSLLSKYKASVKG